MAFSFTTFVAISWSIGGIVSAIISILFLKKNPERKLNQILFSGFFLWALQLVFNGAAFGSAAASMTFSNLLRDFCIICSIFACILLFLAAWGTYFGVETVANKPVLIIFGIIAAGLAGVSVPNDWVMEDGFGEYKTSNNNLGKVCSYVVPMIFAVVAIALYFLTYRSLSNRLAKKRMLFFTIGVSTIGLGGLIFLVDGFLESLVPPVLIPTIAMLMWVTGPVLTLIGLYVKVDVEPTVDIALSAAEEGEKSAQGEKGVLDSQDDSLQEEDTVVIVNSP